MDSLLKRVAPYFEVACFLAAWAVGIAMAVGDRREPDPPLDAREVIASEPAPPRAATLPHRSFRPVPLEDLGEGG